TSAVALGRRDLQALQVGEHVGLLDLAGGGLDAREVDAVLFRHSAGEWGGLDAAVPLTLPSPLSGEGRRGGSRWGGGGFSGGGDDRDGLADRDDVALPGGDVAEDA